jgi:hypothetical protein
MTARESSRHFLGAGAGHRAVSYLPRSTGALRLGADPVAVAIEVVRVGVRHVLTYAEVAVGDIGAVEVRWRRPDTDRRIRGRALAASGRRAEGAEGACP